MSKHFTAILLFVLVATGGLAAQAEIVVRGPVFISNTGPSHTAAIARGQAADIRFEIGAYGAALLGQGNTDRIYRPRS